jgi:hypothetical protein
VHPCPSIARKGWQNPNIMLQEAKPKRKTRIYVFEDQIIEKRKRKQPLNYKFLEGEPEIDMPIWCFDETRPSRKNSKKKKRRSVMCKKENIEAKRKIKPRTHMEKKCLSLQPITPDQISI